MTERYVTVHYYGYDHSAYELKGIEESVGATGITLGIRNTTTDGTRYRISRFFPWTSVQSVDTDPVPEAE